MRGTQWGVRRFALLVALATAGVLVVGAQAASAQVIEICKASTNGMSGRDFNYTVAPSGGSSFAVGPIKGGRCSASENRGTQWGRPAVRGRQREERCNTQALESAGSRC